MQKEYSKLSQLIIHSLPYILLSLGVMASIALGLYLIYEPDVFLQAKVSPFIIYFFLILITALLLATLFLFFLMKKYFKSLNYANYGFKKELLKYENSQKSKENLEKALIQSQKIQAIGTLAAGMAHDFNNLLYAIIGYVEMARDDVQKESIVYTNLGKVLEAASRGQQLISRILSFSRRQRADFSPIYLQATIESVLSLLRPTIPAGVALVFQPMAEDVMILGNQTQIHQVIMNIINNAVDAMEGEGTIAICITPVSVYDDLLKQIPKISDDHHFYKIDITDTGCGMDQNTMERIFEPFFTTKEVGKGTGLGLSTVHSIMTDHQGAVIVNSQLGHGTTFTLLLPEYKEPNNG